jgi:hypothetical protein
VVGVGSCAEEGSAAVAELVLDAEAAGVVTTSEAGVAAGSVSLVEDG